MRQDDFAEERYRADEFTPVQAIMMGLFGLSVAVSLGFALGGAIGILAS